MSRKEQKSGQVVWTGGARWTTQGITNQQKLYFYLQLYVKGLETETSYIQSVECGPVGWWVLVSAQNAMPHGELQSLSPYLNMIPRWPVCSFKSEKQCLRDHLHCDNMPRRVPILVVMETVNPGPSLQPRDLWELTLYTVFACAWSEKQFYHMFRPTLSWWLGAN